LFDETGAVERKAKETAESIYKEAATATDPDERQALAKWAVCSESEARIRAMISLAKSEPSIAVAADQLDADTWLLNCLNGTIDLRTGELRPHQRDDLCTKQVPVEYDPDASCPRWNDFLAEIMGYKLLLASFLHRAVGYALTGDTSEQVLFLLYGTGANGKSSFLETIKAVLGDYARQADPATFLARKHDSVRNDVARLAGARFVSAIEAEEGKYLSEALVKSVTGGDTVAARFLYSEFFEFRPQFKIFLAANHKPLIRGTDNAIWRRVRLVPFTVTIPSDQQDKHLLEKLRAELPGVLAWAVRGCLVWQKHGLEEPKEVQAATESYRDEMDLLGGFLSECCIQGPAAWATAKDLYQAHALWCSANGEHQMGQRRFGINLAERGFQSCKGTHGVRIWRGIGLVARVTEGGASSAKVTHEGGHRGLSQEDRHLVPHRPPVSSDSEPEGVGSLL
jgi:putative DNA primase/helicase